MTKVYLKDKNGQKEICCEGHSGYGVQGEDIVCAAISILVYSFSKVCEYLDRIDHIQINCLEEESGKFSIRISDPLNETGNAYRMLVEGIEALEKNYEKNVKIYSEWEEFEKINL